MCILYCGLLELVLKCVGECMWGHFDNCVGVLVVCVLVFTVFCIFCTVIFIVSFMYNYSCLFYLYYCKDYCHRVETQLQ